ncbi:MAG TPA: deoxyribonuclease IV [Ktedonobacteraceae bacterium]|nr:deoxyribonuclease IV [Ktedonobacteraceae bacterium]
MRLGRHMPTNSQPIKAAELAWSIGCNAIQIFASNPTAWSPPQGGEESSIAFAEAARKYDLDPVVLHAPYLINLASPLEANREKSASLLRWTLQRGALLGAAYVVFHIGSHKGEGVEEGIAHIAGEIAPILAETPPQVGLLLENSVGAGQTLGGEFEHLAAVLKLLPDYSARLGVCLDTAHLWGAGHDISTIASTQEVLRRFDELIGLERLKVLHLNDTEKSLGSKRDVHARVGEGVIGQEGLRALLNDPRLAHVAILMETPIKTTDAGKEDWEHDKQHLESVRQLMQPASLPSTD